MKRRRLVAGNWKMHGSLAMAEELVQGLSEAAEHFDQVEVAVFPPYPYLAWVRQCVGENCLAWGAQNLSEHEAGAHTGEVAAGMLTEFGCRYVLVGHSERRTLYGEDDARVAAKAARAQAHDLIPILCVGESLEQREAGQTEAVVGAQLDAVLDVLGVAAMNRAIVAYEPIWAIGTGRTASPQQAQDVHAYIRHKVAALDATIGGQLRILYGGSVKGSNATQLFAMDDIDGGLVGGASLKLTDFLDICRA